MSARPYPSDGYTVTDGSAMPRSSIGQQSLPAYTPTSATYPNGPVSASSYFSDPLLQQFVNASRSAMASLSRPTTVQTSNPALSASIAALTRLLNAPDAAFEYFRPIAERRMAELDQPGYTKSQLDQIRTQAIDPMTAQRDAARQSVIQRFAAQGIGPDSGIVQQALLDLDRQYAQGSTTQETQLALNAAAQDEARRQERVSVGAQAAGLAGRNQATQMGAAGQLAGIGQNQQQLDLTRQQLDTNKILQAMGLSQNLSQLPIQLQAQQIGALNALQGGIPQYQDPSIEALLSLMGIGQKSADQTSKNTADLWASLIGVAPSLLKAFHGGGDNG